MISFMNSAIMLFLCLITGINSLSDEATIDKNKTDQFRSSINQTEHHDEFYTVFGLKIDTDSIIKYILGYLVIFYLLFFVANSNKNNNISKPRSPRNINNCNRIRSPKKQNIYVSN